MTMMNKKAELYNSDIINEISNSITKFDAVKIEKRMLLAAKIEDAMTAKGLNKIELAERAGKNPSVITKWLSGTHNFTTDTLFEIENILEINLINTESQFYEMSKSYHFEVSSSVDYSTINKSVSFFSENAPLSTKPIYFIASAKAPINNYLSK